MWLVWTPCSNSCGGGTQMRSRRTLQAAKYGGRGCAVAHEQKACSTQDCPVDCQLSAFGRWNHCSRFCGGGSQERARSAVVSAAYGGKSCDALVESRECNTQACAIDCKVSEWPAWGHCSHTCGTGVSTRQRRVMLHAAHGGKACPRLSESKSCMRGPCPIHCVVSEWSMWNLCSKTCGGGTHTREREVLTSPLHGGDVCPTLSQTRHCNVERCPLDCAVTPFDAWSPCSQSCGGGIKTHSRLIVSPASRGGKPCPALDEFAVCNSHVCPADCVESAWGTWTTCDRTCAGGAQKRARSIVLAESFGGAKCSGLLQQARHCNTGPCPVHCKVTDWSDWDQCSHTCGGGTSNRVRVVIVHAAHGGYVCPALKETRACGEHMCPVDCVISPFGAWSSCSKSCAGGVQTQQRVVVTQPAAGGVACPALERTRACGTAPCPLDCKVSQWSEWVSSWAQWGACPVSCAGAQQSRSRSVTRHFEHGGFQCPNLSETRACNVNPCPVDCQLSAFGPWSACTRTCGKGQARRQRTVTQPAVHGGACAALEEYAFCNTNPCPRDCVVTEWSRWSVCSRSCSTAGDGDGAQERTRQIRVTPQHGGLACPVLKELRPCGKVPCGCSHVMCKFKVHEIHLKKTIRVYHTVEEMFGSKHTCKWADGQCRCTCSNFSKEAMEVHRRRPHWADTQQEIAEYREWVGKGGKPA
eukprot:g1076.t1